MLKLNHLAKAATVFGVALQNALKEINSRCQRLRKRLHRASRYLSQLWIGAATTLLVILSQHPHTLIDVANAASVPYVGVNLAGADFGVQNLPGTFGKDYIYPTHDEVDYFMGKGMTVFRLPFRWERLQQQQFANFDATEQARISDFVSYATGKGATVLLDPHNYARYYGGLIGQDVPASAFADFWTKLANLYKSNSRVIFGLMNEPNNMLTLLWRDDANTAIQAIRNTGATNLIFVPGNDFTGAHSWNDVSGGASNADAMLTITDPGNNYAFEVHQYFDSDSSGTSDQCASTKIGADGLVNFTAWLRKNGKRGFLGEFGGGRNDTCYGAIDNTLSYIDSNADVWLGWTYWAAGPWWEGYDWYSVEPVNGQDRPQMAILSKHTGSTPTPTATATATPTATATATPTATATATPTATATATTTATATATPTSSPVTSLKVDVITDSDWDVGYCVHFQVTNTSNTDTKKWQLQFQIPQEQISSSWNLNYVLQGSNYVVTPPDWAQVIPANQTSQASIGLCANKVGTNYKPTQVSATTL